MALTPGGTQRPPPPGQQQQYQVLPQIGTPTMGRMQMADVMGDDRPEKRQRMAYGQGPGGYSQ